MRTRLTPLRRFALLSRWRAQLQADDQACEMDCAVSPLRDDLLAPPCAEGWTPPRAANDALPQFVEPAPRARLGVFFVVPTLVAAIAAVTLALDRCAP